MMQTRLKKIVIYDMAVLLLSSVILLIFFPIGGHIDLQLIQPWISQTGVFLYRDNWYLTYWNHGIFKYIMIVVYCSFLLLWLLSFKIERLKPNRLLYGYMFWISLLSTAVVGLFKSQSRHACPWNMTHPTATGYVWDFSATQGHCFPGGHASTGFALITGYFVYRLIRPKRAYFYLLAGLAIGFVMGWGQMLRGAHFLSHNLWTAWYVYALNSIIFMMLFNKLQANKQAV